MIANACDAAVYVVLPFVMVFVPAMEAFPLEDELELLPDVLELEFVLELELPLQAAIVSNAAKAINASATLR